MAGKQIHRTPRQLKFLECWLTPGSKTFGNAAASAREAGYAEHYAKRMAQFIEGSWIGETIKNSGVSVEEIIAGIKKETTTDASRDRLKAYELLGKYKKMFTDKHEWTGDSGVKFVIEGDGNPEKALPKL